jgi:alditol oxidase
MTERATNWARNVTFSMRRLHRPSTVAELQELVAAAPRVRALGTGHSFNLLADSDSDGDLVDLTGLPPVIDIGAETVTVAAGVRYGELATRLHANGAALHNLASLPHISVAGACATATHGSGVHHGNLATAVRAVELVAGTGELVRLVRGQDGFAGAVVGLGALGIEQHVLCRRVQDHPSAVDTQQRSLSIRRRIQLLGGWRQLIPLSAERAHPTRVLEVADGVLQSDV